jgi:hypothetical protein
VTPGSVLDAVRNYVADNEEIIMNQYLEDSSSSSSSFDDYSDLEMDAHWPHY